MLLLNLPLPCRWSQNIMNVWFNTYTNLPPTLLTQLIYTGTNSTQKGITLFCNAWYMSVLFWICFYQITYQHNHLMCPWFEYLQNKGQCEDKSTSQTIHIFSCTTMIVKHFTSVLTCCRLTLIYCRGIAFWLPSDQWLWNLYCSNNNMVAKYIVLSNIISVLSAYNILCIYIRENLLTLKRFIVLLDILWAYNSLLIRYKVYSSDPRKFLHTRWKHGEGYV